MEDPFTRNCFRPSGEVYAPIYFDQDIMVKLVDKSRWTLDGQQGVYFLTVWDLLVVDLDDINDIEKVKTRVAKAGLSDKYFAVHKTHNGFHLYLLSEKMVYCCLDAIAIRIALGGDPAHGTNSLWTGCSIRLSQKRRYPISEPVSKFVCFIGDEKSRADPEALSVYNKITGWLTKVASAGRHGVKPMINWSDGLFGTKQIELVAPALIIDGRFNVIYQKAVYPNETLKKLYQEKNYNDSELDNIVSVIKNKFKMTRLNRIFINKKDYAVGMNVQESLCYIIYRNLLVVDLRCDNQDDSVLDPVRVWAKDNNQCFRVARSGGGYHCFLTSKKMDYSYDESHKLLKKLGCDPMYIIGTIAHGYAVRVNQKGDHEYPYSKHCYIGELSNERNDLLSLYQMHHTLASGKRLWNYTQTHRPKKNPILMINEMLAK